MNQKRTFAGLILLVVAALAAVEAYGLANASFFRRELWYPEGPEDFIQFTGLYAACATAILILVPWLFARLCATSLVVLTVIALGPQALLATVYFLVSAWALGHLLLRRDHHLLAMLLGVSVYIVLMSFAARLPVNYPIVYLVVLALPIAFHRRLPPPGAIELRTWGERIAFAVLVLFLTAHLFAVLKPEASADGLSMHLAIPADIAANHVMTFEPSRYLWAVMPMGADFAYSIVYLLGGEFAARLLNFAALLAILGLLWPLARRWVSPGVAYMLLALFASAPMAGLITGSLFVENLLAALLLGALASLWKFGDTGDRRYLYTAAVLGGAAMSTKLGAVAVVGLSLPLAAVELYRHQEHALRASLGRASLGRASLVAALLLLAAAAPPYAIAWVKTGNPLFPFLNDRFHSPLLSPGAQATESRLHQPVTWHTPFDLTFHTGRYYEYRDGSFGFQYLLMAPLALLAVLVTRSRQAAGAAAVGLGASAVILSSEPNARYLYPVLPLLYIPCAALLGWAAAQQRLLLRALVALAGICLALNAALLPTQGFYYAFYGPFTEAQRQELLAQIAPIRPVIAWFNRAHPHAPVLLAQDSFIAGLDTEIYENHWHQWGTLEAIRRADGPGGIGRLLENWNVRFVIARDPAYRHYARPESLRRFLDHCVVREYAVNEFYAAHIEPGCHAPDANAAPAAAAGPGVYDDFDPLIVFNGDWERDETFAEADRHTITYNDAPGAQATFAFRGSELVWVFTRAANRGIASITIDGLDAGTFDLYSKDTQWQSRLRFPDLGSGPHVVVIRITGQSHPGAKGHYVDVDSFEVKP